MICKQSPWVRRKFIAIITKWRISHFVRVPLHEGCEYRRALAEWQGDGAHSCRSAASISTGQDVDVLCKKPALLDVRPFLLVYRSMGVEIQRLAHHEGRWIAATSLWSCVDVVVPSARIPLLLSISKSPRGAWAA